MFGTCIHTCIQTYISVFFEQTAKSADELDLDNMLRENMLKEYSKELEKNKGQHFSSAKELAEYFEDGKAILNNFKANSAEILSKKHMRLLGIELPLIHQVIDGVPIFLKGFLDVVLYDERTKKVKIIDIKTSRFGWTDKEKKDECKPLQLVLYKTYISDQYGIEVDDIEVEYMIVRLKLYDSPFPIKRIQYFIPSSGKNTRNKVKRHLQEFITDIVYEDGTFIEKDYPKQPSTTNCKYCPFLKKECDGK